jgi:predicted DNA-binding transcriptional regulator YafY
MLASRLLSILILLQTRGRMSARELAAEFEVAVRTIHRDIDQLSAAGIPVYADRGRNGGFRLQDGYRTKLTGLTQPEAETLFLAGLPGPAAQLGLADLLASARLKLLAALPADVQPRAQRIAARFHLDAVAWFHGVDSLPSLPAIAGAAWSDHLLEMRYRRSGDTEVHSRVVAPLGLVLKAGISGRRGSIWPRIGKRHRAPTRPASTTSMPTYAFHRAACRCWICSVPMWRVRQSKHRARPIELAGCVARCRSNRSTLACAN